MFSYECTGPFGFLKRERRLVKVWNVGIDCDRKNPFVMYSGRHTIYSPKFTNLFPVYQQRRIIPAMLKSFPIVICEATDMKMLIDFQ